MTGTLWLKCFTAALPHTPLLQEHQSKLERVTVVREELKSHLANLPDFSKLPMGSATSLAPLPTVGDLFN